MIEKESHAHGVFLPNPAGDIGRRPPYFSGRSGSQLTDPGYDPALDKVLLTLSEAAGRLSVPKRQMLRLARVYDVAHVEIDGEFFFRPAALEEWARRNEHKALG